MLVNKTNSKILLINCGVPQGSVLGPLLFLLYVNDIEFSGKFDNLNLFADDTSLFVFSNKIDNIVEESNILLDQLCSLFHANKLNLSIDKCIFTIIS